MSKFKAGDKVITTQRGGWYDAGEVFTLSSRYVDDRTKTVGWLVKEKDTSLFVHENRIKLASPKPMLKNGMRVKCRNGSMWTYLDGVFVAVTSDFSDYNYLDHMMPVNSSSWTDDLINDFGERFDVMEIFDAPAMVCLYFKYDEETPSVWKRVEKSEAELRLEQMQAKAAELQNEMAKLQKDIAEGKV